MNNILDAYVLDRITLIGDASRLDFYTCRLSTWRTAFWPRLDSTNCNAEWNLASTNADGLLVQVKLARLQLHHIQPATTLPHDHRKPIVIYSNIFFAQLLSMKIPRSLLILLPPEMMCLK
jgi:hypothetical protein